MVWCLYPRDQLRGLEETRDLVVIVINQQIHQFLWDNALFLTLWLRTLLPLHCLIVPHRQFPTYFVQSGRGVVEGDCQSDGTFGDFGRNEKEVSFCGRDRHGDEEVGIEANGHLLASGADDRRFELADHETAHVGVDPFGVVQLTLSTHLLVGLDLLAALEVLLLLHQVQVLRKTVNQVGNELLRILLPKP